MASQWNAQGAVVAITGGQKGIGLELSRRLYAAGAKLIVLGRDAAALSALAEELHGTLTVQGDVSDPQARASFLSTARDAYGHIDCLINNAGIQTYPDFVAGADLAAVDRELAVNLTAPIHLCAEAVPLLQSSDRAAIINVASGLAIAPKETAPVYCATKAGLRSFSTALRYQLEGESIRVAIVYPPLVKTEMTEGRNDGAMSAAAAAEETLKKFYQGKDEIYLGQANILPLMMRLAPGFVHKRLRGIGKE